MYREKKIAVVIPAYNEEGRVATVLDTLPEYVDYAVVVDDCSIDNTFREAMAAAERSKVEIAVERLDQNRGVGAAIEAGYRKAFDSGFDIVAVMAGDGQMDPRQLHKLLNPLVEGVADYAKGNRFSGGAIDSIPGVRLVGNAVLSILTKIASGYWHISDSQNGYTAITADAARILLEGRIYPCYGMPNDVLVKLNVHQLRVADIPMQAIYGVGEQSKMRIPRVVLPIAWLLVQLFFHRMWRRYVVRDTHPLVFFYMLGLVLTPLGLVYGLLILLTRVVGPTLLGITFFETFRPVCSASGIVLDAVLTISGVQMLLFAMWFDMQANFRLRQ